MRDESVQPRATTPEEIERRSFAIIAAELGDTGLPAAIDAVVKRVIHATADFDYCRTLHFSDGATTAALAALRSGCAIVTDTQMAKAGISAKACRQLGCELHCHIADEDIGQAAKEAGTTRSRLAVDKAAARWPEGIYVIGNAPTALIRIYELIREEKLRPSLVVGAPVGFVNVVESKGLLMECAVPRIVARGRKGGSTVAAAIMNALLYQAIATGEA